MKVFTQKFIGLLGVLFIMSLTVSAQDNYSLSFDGVDDYVDLGSSNTIARFLFSSGSNLSIGLTNADINASSEIWDFFSKYDLSETNLQLKNYKSTNQRKLLKVIDIWC